MPPRVIPAKAGIQAVLVQAGTGNWIPAFAGMTVNSGHRSQNENCWSLLQNPKQATTERRPPPYFSLVMEGRAPSRPFRRCVLQEAR